ncbi:hypothetical protein [Methylobacterium sp. 10]|nr:hypothetical protein [Methylobacterium sp. 10]
MRSTRPPGLTGRWLIQRFAEQAADDPMPADARSPGAVLSG